MEDSHHHNHNHQQQQHQTTGSRLGARNTGGEIVEVQGGHIVRSTGRKDRHSKVCTAKGPRDRRVRLSAHTAIQFYDVQDRLGYDRPSKAVDWLIKKAKDAIDQLAELPAWKPTTGLIANPNLEQGQQQHQQPQVRIHNSSMVGSSSIENEQPPHVGVMSNNHHRSENNCSFLPPSMDSDSIADTIKSFFPMGASGQTNSSAMQFQNFTQPDLLSRSSSQTQSQDLRLSLQSFQDPILLHHHHNQQVEHPNPTHHTEPAQALFSGTTTQLGFDGSGWSENQPAEIGRFQRMVPWNASGDTGTGGGGGGVAFMFNSPQTQPLFGGQTQFGFQRGPLQSSNTPSIRAWMDPSAIAAATDHHHHHHHQFHQTLPFLPSSISGIGFAPSGGFSGFRIPARIQGEDEEHDGISDKPSSASSDSHH